MAYTLTSSSASVNEDSTVRITVYTTGLSNGTLVPYSISGTGINSADFVGSPLLTGNFVINSNQATITLNPKADFKTEFPETVTLMLDIIQHKSID